MFSESYSKLSQAKTSSVVTLRIEGFHIVCTMLIVFAKRFVQLDFEVQVIRQVSLDKMLLKQQ